MIVILLLCAIQLLSTHIMHRLNFQDNGQFSPACIACCLCFLVKAQFARALFVYYHHNSERGSMHRPAISKRVSLSKLTKVISSFALYNRIKTLESPLLALQLQLDTAQPAEEPWDAFSYPNIYTDPGDGIWICECGFENQLIHYRGSYPSKYLAANNASMSCPRTTRCLKFSL